MKDGIGEGYTREDHPDISNQLFASYAKVQEARALASVVGEEELSDLDKMYMRFGRAFEAEFVNQDFNQNRDITETLDLGWLLLGHGGAGDSGASAGELVNAMIDDLMAAGSRMLEVPLFMLLGAAAIIITSCALLLERLARIEELRWVRFLYAYPNKITGRLLETIAGHEKICSYVDVPLQHASAAVLKRMQRGGSGELFLRSIEKMRRTIPGLTLRTSFIVGFPGESAADFDELCQFVGAARFDWMGVFGYSDEEGARAFALDTKVSPREIERRRKKLMQLQQRISRQAKQALVGREFDLLVEGPSAETELLWEGRTPMHAPEIDGKVFVNDFGGHAELRPGEFYRCEITEAHDYDVVARIL
jgi:hypothetical protein